jgi:hypothetical protein
VRRSAAALLLALTACSSGGSAAPTGAPAAPDPVPSLEVREPAVWVCHPDLDDDPCRGELDVVAVSAAGSQPLPAAAATDPPVDCFYVYPTVSDAPGTNAPKEAAPAVVATVRAQAAAFSSVCRVFAPAYRQVTTTALRSGGYFDPAAQQVAYDDVRDAWRTYLNERDDGRGVVLVGHSQGAMHLARLLSDDVLAEPAVGELVVSALLVGGGLTTAAGSSDVDRAGGFPACREAGQTGCVVGYSAFADVPPRDAFFGRTVPGREVLCTDPTVLSGDPGALDPLLPADRVAGLGVPVPAGAGFVAYPGALRGECRTEPDGAAWLQVSTAPGAALPDGGAAQLGRLGPQWGLHVVDVSLALGDLVEAVRLQAQTWTTGS